MFSPLFLYLIRVSFCFTSSAHFREPSSPNGTISQKIRYVTQTQENINLKGYQNHIIGTKAMAGMLDGWRDIFGGFYTFFLSWFLTHKIFFFFKYPSTVNETS